MFVVSAAGTLAASGELTVIDPDAAYPEGPVLIAGTVYYAEMGADRVMLWDGTRTAEVWSEPGCMPTSVARGAADSLVILCHAGALVRISQDGRELGRINRADANGLFDNPNASVSDARGGIYFSSSGGFAPGAPATGALLYLSPDGTLRRLAGNIHYANGVTISLDGRRLFASEHLERKVWAFDVAEGGRLANPRVFLALDDVVPPDPERSWEVGTDGLATDAAGNLYVVEYGAGRVVIVGPDAGLIGMIDVPEAYVTAPILIDGGRRLFITAPASLLDPRRPGRVYVVDNPAYRGG